jgi:Leucine-rich repeat (LRR) protein
MIRNQSSTSQQNSPPKPGEGVKLSQEFLMMKTRLSLHQIMKLNLWGNNLGDISIIQSLPNLEVVALTINHITSLKDFQFCYKLRELYLRGNKIPADISELQYLRQLRSLKVLNLAENPISSILPFYRTVTIKFLPWLEKLDDIPVTPVELQMA